MNHIAAQEDLRIISEILNQWKTEGIMDSLGYDLLLHKIRGLYENVKFGFPKEERAGIRNVTEPAVPLAVDESADTQTQDEKVQTSGSSTLSSKIHTLYGEYSSSEKRAFVSSETSVSEYMKGTEKSPTLETDNRNDAAYKTASKQILGDVLGNPRPTIADNLQASQGNDTSLPGYEKISSLRNAIGINDKYMFVRELFAGDQQKYEKAIATLDSFSEIEDAILYINDNYSWSTNNKAAETLYDMLASKLL